MMTTVIQQEISRPKPPRVDFNDSPYLVLWELTRACSLACKHCRAKAIRRRNPDELTIEECKTLLDDMTRFGKPLIVLTGGDPVQRPDLFDIIREAKSRGFTVAITPSATPLMSKEIVAQMKESGIERIAISIDGPDKELHDGFRRVDGSFQISLDIARWARELDLPLQINTTVSALNLDRFDEMPALISSLGAVLWSVFFLVPTGRANNSMQITAQQAEEVMHKMAALSATAPFHIKSTAAPQFRRVLLETYGRKAAQPAAGAAPAPPAKTSVGAASMPPAEHALSTLAPDIKLGALRSYEAVNDGKGILFISHTGEVYPSGFLPLAAGNVRESSVVDIYREHPLFKELRDPSLLKGKCGGCRYRAVCGGSRARAYGSESDYLAQDDLCVFPG